MWPYLCEDGRLEWLADEDIAESEGMSSKLSPYEHRSQTRKSFMYKATRLILLVILIVVTLLIPTGQASAALRSCRTDPIFKLSNGDVITITLDIDTDALNVRNVTYALHVPLGVTVTKVTYTAGGIGTKELYKVYQDSPAKIYTTDTLVTTQNTGSVQVIATTRLNATFAKSISGYSGTHLVVTVMAP